MKPALILTVLLSAACCAQPAPQANAPEPSITLTEDGIAGLDGQIPFTLPAIERAFPGLDVVAAPAPESPAFEVREPGSNAALFVVAPDWTLGFVGSISTQVPAKGGPISLQAGVSTLEDLPESLQQRCHAPANGPVSCTVPLASGSLILGFSSFSGALTLDSVAYVLPATDR